MVEFKQTAYKVAARIRYFSCGLCNCFLRPSALRLRTLTVDTERMLTIVNTILLTIVFIALLTMGTLLVFQSFTV